MKENNYIDFLSHNISFRVYTIMDPSKIFFQKFKKLRKNEISSRFHLNNTKYIYKYKGNYLVLYSK